MHSIHIPRIQVSFFRNVKFSFERVSKREKTSLSDKQIKSKTGHWQSVVGLEIHAQISSRSKLFSGASTNFGSPVNCNVSFFDAATPGTLPVLNRSCVEAAVLTALALSCKINAVSLFDRKHYFYADLPAGYQITQQRAPIAEDGKLQFQVYTPSIHKKPYLKSSRIKQLQLEQDSGKSLHDSIEKSLVDLNRAGVPLMELVFEPDLEDGEEAAALVKELCLILLRLNTCSCKMEEGALRVDANVSVHQPSEPLGTRTEIKNIGSIRGVANAIQFEIQRQINILNKGGVVINETRSWDPVYKQTLPMRDKEEKQDYRYMPEPNLPPLRLLIEGQLIPKDAKNLVNVTELQNRIPELPEETRRKLIKQYGLSSESAIQLVNEDQLLQHFIEIMKLEGRDAQMIVNILLIHLLTTLNKNKLSLEKCSVTSATLGEIVDLLQEGRINLLIAKKVLNEVVIGNSKSPSLIVEERKWIQITDEDEITKICADVLKNNQKMVEQYRNGKTKLFDAFVGLVAKHTDQRANMEVVVKKLKMLLQK
ncbi:hypothetical protein R5R35_000026 [Gryllus longicercus]|uniref:Glutamyl-tRNA(Gln) amidotransferase subunit B, mitochondrial n=1 Tax=Gryllus longicercus TaxID=2509291 RepID=A0AAN9VLH6_9ORTH